jgi:DNA invertase Pin-like site-specific DNA recombinase
MQMGALAEFELAMARERKSADLAAARAEGRIGGWRKKLEDTKRHEIAEAVISGRKTAAQMARMFSVPPPTVSRIMAARAAGLLERLLDEVASRGSVRAKADAQ